jgi:hypothetical protein
MQQICDEGCAKVGSRFREKEGSTVREKEGSAALNQPVVNKKPVGDGAPSGYS